jgi:hypothetical protein
MPKPIDGLYSFDHKWFYIDRLEQLRGDPKKPGEGFDTQAEALKAQKDYWESQPFKKGIIAG